MSLLSNSPGKSCNAEQKQYWHHAPVWVSVSIVVTEKVVLPNLEIKELKWRQYLWDLWHKFCSPFCHELSWEVGQHLKEGLHTILVPKIKCHRSACIALGISYTNMPIITFWDNSWAIKIHPIIYFQILVLETLKHMLNTCYVLLTSCGPRAHD